MVMSNNESTPVELSLEDLKIVSGGAEGGGGGGGNLA